MRSGEAIETGIVGADGIVGGDAAINGHAFGRSTVQLSGAALTMPKAKFINAYLAHPRLRNLVDRYQAILLIQAQQNAACHALHSVRSRLCRWLLQSQDMIGRDTFHLTQEFSHMLGVRRTTVSIDAHALQEAGLIRYRRGQVTILNRNGLEDCKTARERAARIDELERDLAQATNEVERLTLERDFYSKSKEAANNGRKN